MLEMNGEKEKGGVRNTNPTNGGGSRYGGLIITKGKKGMLSSRAIGEIKLMMFYSREMRMGLQAI